MLGNKEIMAENIRHYMEINRKTRNQICDDLGFKYSTFSDWVTGEKYPRIDKIEILANYFGIQKSDLVEKHVDSPKSIAAIRIPVYGRVAAGIPMEATENIIDYEEIPASWPGEYAALKVKGDSMEPKISEGDILIVRIQQDAESGDVVVAMVNGSDATVKKLIKHASGIVLQPFNPAYEPMYFTHEQAREMPVTIWGKVVENRQKF